MNRMPFKGILQRAFLPGLLALLLFVVVQRQPEAMAQQPMTPAGGDTFYLPFVAQPTYFKDTFDGTPAAPLAWRGADWNVAVHSRDRGTWFNLDAMQAAHGPECQPPPASHPNTSYGGAVFQCANHMMTAMNAGGYGAIYLTPNALVDFDNGTATIRFDVSTLRSSGRDWWDVWITPYEDNLIAPLSESFPDLSGEPRRAIHIDMDRGMGVGPGLFKVYAINNHNPTQLTPLDWGLNYMDFLVPDARRRDTFEIQISRTGIKFGMPAHNAWWVDTTFPQPLDWGTGIVQLGHHSYNPTKACQNDGSCGPNTWHWDNFFVSPTQRFTMIPATTRFAEPANGGTFNFATPAPPGSHLRFSGIGNNLQVSFNGGGTWQTAQLQNQEEFDDGHFRTYWLSIPAGATSVRISGSDWWGGAWHARDASIWSLVDPGKRLKVSPLRQFE